VNARGEKKERQHKRESKSVMLPRMERQNNRGNEWSKKKTKLRHLRAKNIFDDGQKTGQQNTGSAKKRKERAREHGLPLQGKLIRGLGGLLQEFKNVRVKGPDNHEKCVERRSGQPKKKNPCSQVQGKDKKGSHRGHDQTLGGEVRRPEKRENWGDVVRSTVVRKRGSGGGAERALRGKNRRGGGKGGKSALPKVTSRIKRRGGGKNGNMHQEGGQQIRV